MYQCHEKQQMDILLTDRRNEKIAVDVLINATSMKQSFLKRSENVNGKNLVELDYVETFSYSFEQR